MLGTNTFFEGTYGIEKPDEKLPPNDFKGAMSEYKNHTSQIKARRELWKTYKIAIKKAIKIWHDFKRKEAEVKQFVYKKNQEKRESGILRTQIRGLQNIQIS